MLRYVTDSRAIRGDGYDHGDSLPQSRSAVLGNSICSNVHPSKTTNISSLTSTCTALSTSNSPSTFEIESLKARLLDMEEKLSQATSTATSVHSKANRGTPPVHILQTTTSLAGTIDVIQDGRHIGHNQSISRSIAHKNRVFGQSHWMNGFVMVCLFHIAF